MSWDYRVVHSTHKSASPPVEDLYAIYEAYYDRLGNVEFISADPTYPAGETMYELNADIRCYLEALEKPILEYSDIVPQDT